MVAHPHGAHVNAKVFQRLAHRHPVVVRPLQREQPRRGAQDPRPNKVVQSYAPHHPSTAHVLLEEVAFLALLCFLIEGGNKGVYIYRAKRER